MDSEALITMPADKLLDKFGGGGHTPGSGSAAALLGLLSCKLIQTVIALTSQREAYEEAHDTLASAVAELVDQVEPDLLEAFEADARQFARVIEARRSRDGASKDSPEAKKLGDLALEELRRATELPLEMAEMSLKLGEHATTVFELGFKGARGDSVVAITAAHAAVGGCLGIVYLNLKSFRGGQWVREILPRVEAVADSWQRLGRVAQVNIEKLREEALQQNRVATGKGGRKASPEVN